MSGRDHSLPTLTQVACPGERLRDQGLWLPARQATAAPDTAGAANPDWSSAMPFELHHRSAALRDRVQARVDQALQAFFASRENSRHGRP